MGDRHAQCLRTSKVLLVARTRHIAEHFRRSILPLTVEGIYVSSAASALGYCNEHVTFLLIGDWYMSDEAEKTRDALLARGFKEGKLP